MKNLFCLLFCLLILPSAESMPDNALVRSHMSGTWFNPEVSGAGVVLEILQNDEALITWYTYDTEGQQLWLYGVGQIRQQQISFEPLYRTVGEPFSVDISGNPADNIKWGKVTLEFDSCDQMRLMYQGPAEFGSGHIQMQRLTRLRSLRCQDDRAFLMGFTPFPYAVTQDGIDVAYDIIAQHADLIAHHFDDGVPWLEMAQNHGFDHLPENIQEDWQTRLRNTPAGHRIYLALTPIAISRDQLAPYKASSESIPLEQIGAPWNTAAFDDAMVIQAYRNYVQTAVQFFRPDFLAIGIEVNLLFVNRPNLWNAYVELQRQVYSDIKSIYPSLPVFFSVTANEFYPEITDVDYQPHLQAFRQIEPYTDFFALSVYPYMSALLTESIPDDYFRTLDAISEKPMSITETGYVAETQSLDFGNGQSLQFSGTDAKQQQWIRFILNEAQARDMRFVVNFVNRDYDALCQQIGCDDADRLWEDTGLFDENNRARPALEDWQQMLQRPFRN